MSLRHPVANRHTLYSCMSLSADSSLMLGIVWRVPPPSFLQNVCICTCVRVNGCAQCVGVGGGVCVCVCACVTVYDLFKSVVCLLHLQVVATAGCAPRASLCPSRCNWQVYIFLFIWYTSVLSIWQISVLYFSSHGTNTDLPHGEKFKIHLETNWKHPCAMWRDKLGRVSCVLVPKSPTKNRFLLQQKPGHFSNWETVAASHAYA